MSSQRATFEAHVELLGFFLEHRDAIVESIAKLAKERRFIEIGTGKADAADFNVLSSHHVTGTLANPQTLEIPVEINASGDRNFAIRDKRPNKRDAEYAMWREAWDKTGTGPRPCIWVDFVELEGPVSANASSVATNASAKTTHIEPESRRAEVERGHLRFKYLNEQYAKWKAAGGEEPDGGCAATDGGERDPLFEEKFWDVIGLYLNPPDKALVLCCDEKSQCQALERTQPGLPLAPRHPRTMTHDYRRHGTITLFAALNYLEGTLISRTEQRHTHVEWLRFLKQIEREAPRDAALHLIVDNYATHKHAAVKAWLARRPRFVVHFTPTGSSWMNPVKRFFADLTGDVIRAGSFASVGELVRDIRAYLKQRNADPKRYVWKAQGVDILAKISRARVAVGGGGL